MASSQSLKVTQTPLFPLLPEFSAMILIVVVSTKMESITVKIREQTGQRQIVFLFFLEVSRKQMK